MNKKVTLSTLNRMKREQQPIAMVTAYDAAFARLAEAAGVEAILVGDSLGMVVQGHDSTLPVSVDEMVYHTSMVKRGSQWAFIIADMPFMSHGTPSQALDSAGRLMKEGGAHMVKLEGGHAQVDTVRHLTARAVPVCAHLGLLPQSIHQLGGYKVQGRDSHSAEGILRDALALQEAGAQMLVLECVPELLGKEVSLALEIPVIGIGAGRGCDGQVLVLHDLLGITQEQAPRFSRDFMADTGSVQQALSAYVSAVHDRSFPAQEHCFQ